MYALVHVCEHEYMYMYSVHTLYICCPTVHVSVYVCTCIYTCTCYVYSCVCGIISVLPDQLQSQLSLTTNPQEETDKQPSGFRHELSCPNGELYKPYCHHILI